LGFPFAKFDSPSSTFFQTLALIFILYLVSSEISDLQNRWLHVICACQSYISGHGFRKRRLFIEISNTL